MEESKVLPEKSTESTAVIVIAPEGNPAVVALTSEVKKLRDYALARTVTSDADLTPLTDDLTLIAKVKKSITEYKETYVRPIKIHLDSVTSVFNSLLDVLKEADTVNRGKFTTYKMIQERKAREIDALNQQAQEVARKQAELNHGEFTVDTTPVIAPIPVAKVSTNQGSASTYKVPKHEVIDFKLLSDDYKMADEVKLGRVIKATNGGITIPGVRIWMEDSIKVNTR